MALVPLREMDEIAPADRPAAEAGLQAFGRLLHTWQAITNSPQLMSVYLPFVRTLTGPGELEQRIKELVAIRVGVLNHCRYTVSHRCTSARAQAVAEQDMVAVAKGDYPGFPAKLRLALEFTDAVTLEVPATSRPDSATGISSHLRSRIAAEFSPGELVELLMSIGIWNGLARFHRVMDFDLDLPAAPQGVEDAL
jgi:AhpD family alkylhydroperoxidase